MSLLATQLSHIYPVGRISISALKLVNSEKTLRFQRQTMHNSFTSIQDQVCANFPSPSTVEHIASCLCIRDLLSSLEKRLFTVEELLRYTLHSALLQNTSCNFITEVLWEEALAQSLFLDQTLQRTGKLVGAFHGIPIALKDDIDVKGYDSSLGCKCGCLRPKYVESHIVQSLRKLGAVPFVKTNVPWHLIGSECANTIFGMNLAFNSIQAKLRVHSTMEGLAVEEAVAV
jgi:hypothetical protein